MNSTRSLVRQLAVVFHGALLGAVPALAAPRQLAAEFPTKMSLVCAIPHAETVQVADVDGDGFNDIVAIENFENALVWLRHRGTSGVGDATFDAPRTLVRLGEYGLSSVERALAIGDTNGDGLVDFYINSASGEELVQVTNLGAGQVAAPVVVLSPATLPYVSVGANVSLADVDGDGDLDVIVPNLSYNSFLYKPGILENVGGQMTPWGGSPTFEVPGRDLAFADLDGDGDLDIAVAGFLCYWLENVAGQYVRHPYFALGQTYTSVYTEDLDLDGDLDLMYTGRQFVATLENSDGMGTLLPPSVQPVRSDRTIVVDMDGDGDVDLFAVGHKLSGNGSVIPSWMENQSGQTFAAPAPVTSERVRDIRSVRLGDLNGDGRQDVIFARNGGLLTAILGQAPVGQLALQSSTIDLERLAVGLIDLVTADVDGDGDLDLVTSSLDHGLRVALQGVGAGMGDLVQILPSVASSQQCLALDLDGDQLPDLVFRTGDDSLAVAFNAGGGSFAPPLLLGTPGGYGATPQALDLDRSDELGSPGGADRSSEARRRSHRG